jgi:hypothetical protein
MRRLSEEKKIHNCPDCYFVSYYTFASYFDLPDRKNLSVLIATFIALISALSLDNARPILEYGGIPCHSFGHV